MDSVQKLGRFEDTGFIHYDTGLLTTEQFITQLAPPKSGAELLHALLTTTATNPLLANTRLNYLGVEGHWKVYNIEG